MLGNTGCLLNAAEMLSVIICGGHFDCFFHDNVPDGLRNDMQHFKNRHTTTDEGGKRTSEARQADLVGDDAEDGEFDPP